MEEYLNNENKIKTKLFLVVLMSFAVVVALIFLFWFFKSDKPILDEKAGAVVKKEENPFKNISLEAKSAYVWDAEENKPLFSLNEQTQLPLASVTKLMTALLVSDMVPEGTIITIKPEDLLIEGDSGLKNGERWTLSNALDFTLVSSSNDGAHALASVIGFIRAREEGKTEEEIFIEEMNKKAKELGLTQTFFLSESGLDLTEWMSGSYGSAKDMAMLMENIVETKPNLLEATKYSDLNIKSKDYIHSVENTNPFVETIPGIIGSKTGFTDLAGGNLVVAFDVGIGHPIVVSVLGSSWEGRFEDVRKLVEASIKNFAQ